MVNNTKLYLIGGINEPKEECSLVLDTGKKKIVFAQWDGGAISSKLRFQIRDILLAQLGFTVDDLEIKSPFYGVGMTRGDGTLETDLEEMIKQVKEFKKEFK